MDRLLHWPSAVEDFLLLNEQHVQTDETGLQLDDFYDTAVHDLGELLPRLMQQVFAETQRRRLQALQEDPDLLGPITLYFP